MTTPPRVVFYAAVAALGGLLFGFETAVISGATEWLRATFQLDDFWLGFTVSAALVGTIVGSVAVGPPADRYGRRAALVGVAVLFVVASFGCAFAWDWWSFVLFRFVGGVAVGGASVVSPMYVAEIAPAGSRGTLVALTQFNIVFGILLAYLSNYAIGQLALGDHAARWMFGVMAVPSVAFLVLLAAVPQSPRWLVARGRDDDAHAVLAKLGVADAAAEVGSIQASLEADRAVVREPFFSRKYRKPIQLAVAIAAFNQLSGINAVLYYSADIFRAAGAATDSALLQSAIVGLTNLVFTMAALVVIDRAGRRVLMLVGSVGYVLSLTVVAWAFYTGAGGVLVLVGLLAFVASHAFGQGAVIWVFISEVFPNSVRARGQALGSFTHWVMAAAISWTFPMIAATAGWLAFAFYAVCCVGQLAWVLAVMPETKGESLEAIQKKLGID